MKKTLFPLAFAAVALTTACSDNEIINDGPQNPIDQKEMISFSLSDEASSTRAGFTGSATSLAMRIQSDEKGGSGVRYTRTVANADIDATNSTVSYSAVTFTGSNKRYWDDAFGRKALLSVYAIAVPNASSSLTNNSKTLEELLSAGDATNDWGTVATNTIAWQITTSEQQKDAAGTAAPVKNIDKEDLVYSNNIQENTTLGKDGVYRWDYSAGAHRPTATGEEGVHKNGRMLFYQQSMTDANAATTPATSDPGHFDKGHLKFKHALSRITVQLISGEGFATPAPFAFATGTNIKLLGMKVSGKLDVKTGVWSNVSTSDINKIAKTTTETNAAGTYVAQMLPGYTFTNGDATNVMEFTIDNNVYYITQDMLFGALTYDANGNGTKDTGDGDLVGTTSPITMEQGKNYTFKITINKKQIEQITATLADWVDVTAADESMNNSHVEFTFLSPTGTNCTEFQFYRLKQDLGSINTTNSYDAANYQGDYKTEGAATIEAMTGTNAGKYQATGWYFDDNKTAYHFRTLNSLAADEGGSDTTDKSENIKNVESKSVFTMTADATTKDYHWGAPMATGKNLAYSTTEGFKNNLHKGVTSTESDLKITELHMMANLNIVLKTSTGTDKVVLDGATITLTKLSTKATVDMGIGLITPLAPKSPATWETATQTMTAPGTYWATGHETNKDQTNAFTCAVIPQSLKRGSSPYGDDDYIGITITTSDANQYYVVKRLSEIVANSVTADQRNQTEGAAIEYWYPNHSYTYTFTITKNMIDCITATVANWIDVTAANKDITLED